MTIEQVIADNAECGALVIPTIHVNLSDGGKVKRKANAAVSALTMEDFAAAIAAGGAKDSLLAPGATKTLKLTGTSELPATELAGEKTLRLIQSAAVTVD